MEIAFSLAGQTAGQGILPTQINIPKDIRLNNNYSTCHKESISLTSIWSTDLKTESSNGRLCSAILLVPTTPIFPGICACTHNS